MSLPDTIESPPAGCAVRFANLGCEVRLIENETVLECARRTGIPIASACGGRGVCGSCLIRVVAGPFEVVQGSQTDPTFATAGTDWLRACNVRALGDIVVELSPRAFATVYRNDSEIFEDEQDCEVDPVIETDTVRISGSTRALGLAVDLGTTNIAASLTDLASGIRLACLGMANPQSSFGADLITRINHAIRVPGGAKDLQTAAVAALSTMAALLCEGSAATPDNIVDITICGNTAMHHLLLGLPVVQLGRAPFLPATCSAMDLRGSDLGLKNMPDAAVHLLPTIGGFVGGDHVATLLATERYWNSGTSLVIDIGTNTEISLIHNGSIITASAASGPALEAGNISCGMRAAEGAIEKVWLDEGTVMTRVIGDCTPVGLCGSGVLDTLVVLRRSGIINQRGYILPDGANVTTCNGQQAYCFSPDITFTQNDVRSVLLAKAAIRAAIDMLLQEADTPEEALDTVIIAGAFGAYLDLASAMAIGLLPTLPPERFRQVGNAAGSGVRLALISQKMRARSIQLAVQARHVDLINTPGFQKTFINRIAI